MKKNIYLVILLLITISITFAEITPEDKVVSSNTSEIFHRESCRYASTLDETNSETFATYQDAVANDLRPCKVCEPTPADIIDPTDPTDPNIINIDPTIEATNLFPINGVVLQADYCNRPMDPNDIGTRIIKPAITNQQYDPNYIDKLCYECIQFDKTTGEGNIPQEYLIPVYDPFPVDPNDPNIVSYKISNSLSLYKSDQSYNLHLDSDCKAIKSVPVHVVNMRNGLIAGSDAFWNPVKGIVEWRITKFEAGDYQFVMNSDIGQTSLLAITIRAKEIPDVNDFSKNWLKGNFNLVKYSDWLSNRDLWLKYLSRVESAGGEILDSNRIEWAFVDGTWKPINGGDNLVKEINADSVVTENNTVDRKTIIKEIKIAPFEWRNTEVKTITTDTTTFDGYESYRSRPPQGSTDYLRYPPFGDQVKYTETEPNAAQIAAHYEEIGISPPPETVEKPAQSFEEMMGSAEEVKNFTALPEDMRMTTYSTMIDSYVSQKEAYEKYLIKKEEWDEEFQRKEQEWQETKIAEIEGEMMMHRHQRTEEEYDYMVRTSTAENIAHIYVSAINELTEQEKNTLLRMRRRILDREIELNPVNIEDIEATMQRIDNAVSSEPNSISTE